MNGRQWARAEIAQLRKLYPHMSTKRVAAELGRSESSVYGAAATMGLKKSPAYLASPEACRLRRGDELGKPYRFKKGHVPVNKGLRRPGWAPGRMRTTQFKKGQISGYAARQWKPLWSDRISKDGYLEIKVRERKGRPGNWVGAHILLWEDKHGAMPAGHALVFKDGDKAHVALSNLELISRAELMRRNAIHNRYPEEMVRAIMMLGAVKRKLRERRAKEHHD
jgi:hypothetical protein